MPIPISPLTTPTSAKSSVSELSMVAAIASDLKKALSKTTNQSRIQETTDSSLKRSDSSSLSTVKTLRTTITSRSKDGAASITIAQ